jgi:hypothetical protein
MTSPGPDINKDATKDKTPREATKPDQDVHKGAVEDETPNEKSNAPALDAEGLPNDETKIRGNALSAREDGTQG